MTWLFLRFYIGVLAVLFLAWFIHGAVLEHRSDAELARVIWAAHAGGARLVAREMSAVGPQQREARLAQLQAGFAYPLRYLSIETIPDAARSALASGRGVAYYRDDDKHFVVAAIDEASSCVRLGPFPSYRRKEVEDSIAGWMQLTAKQIPPASDPQRTKVIAELQGQFEIPITLVQLEQLPEQVRRRVEGGDQVIFFEREPDDSDRYFSVTRLSESDELLQFGPFPSFERIEQNAATTTLALVLLPAALAIAIMLRPVARQLRDVENVAKSIASGRLDARVDENRVTAARPLADAFNLMADRTQSLVKSQRELLQAVSHEIRTPLARIRFAADLIETAQSDQERQERLKAVDDATQQLDELVGELLTCVRADSEEVTVPLESFCVNDLIEEVVTSVEPLHPELCISRVGDCVNLVGDRAGLRRALSNLVRNPASFARQEIRVSVKRIGKEVHILVDDDGPGIPPQDRERVFRPFERLSKRADGGSGLGLALVERIVRASGGTTAVHTAPAGGARFEIKLPDRDQKQEPGKRDRDEPTEASQQSQSV